MSEPSNAVLKTIIDMAILADVKDEKLRRAIVRARLWATKELLRRKKLCLVQHAQSRCKQ